MVQIMMEPLVELRKKPASALTQTELDFVTAHSEVYPEEYRQELSRLLLNEGGLVNNPQDPGRMTKFGISARSYPLLDIANLQIPQVHYIYWRDFWQVIDGDDMHKPLSFQALDFAVNSSPQTAIRKLQQVLDVADDGDWGPVTKDALAVADGTQVTIRFVSARLRYFTQLERWPTFGKGWSVRIADDLDYLADDLL